MLVNEYKRLVNDDTRWGLLTLLLKYAACIAIACLSLYTDSSFAQKKIEAAREDLTDVKQQIEAIKKQIDSNQQQQDDVTDALKASETAISQADQKLRKINQKQRLNESSLAELKKQSLSINEKLAQQQKQLSQLLYQQYAHGNQSYAQLILQNKHPNEISRDLKYQSYIAKAHAKLISDMQNSLDQVKSLNVKTTVALQEVIDLKQKQEAEKKALQAKKQEKAQVLKTIANQIATQRNQIKKLSRDEKQLSDLVQKLSRVVVKPVKPKTKKIIKPDEDDGKPAQTVVTNNDSTPDDTYAGANFKSLKGKLKLPVRGQLMNHFGDRRENSITWKGLFIKANEGADVKAVASGRVIFADWMRGFGNLIIIDHGNGYMSLYGNNESVLKSVGEDISAGDTIAAVGNTGGNETNGVYYELRKQSVPFDPLDWSTLR